MERVCVCAFFLGFCRWAKGKIKESSMCGINSAILQISHSSICLFNKNFLILYKAIFLLLEIKAKRWRSKVSPLPHWISTSIWHQVKTYILITLEKSEDFWLHHLIRLQIWSRGRLCLFYRPEFENESKLENDIQDEKPTISLTGFLCQSFELFSCIELQLLSVKKLLQMNCKI